MTLAGIDVSHYQPTTPSLTGLAFAFAKASEGTTPDALYSTHMAAFTKAGLVTGAYHFARADVATDAQASFFVKTAAGAQLLAVDNEGSHALTKAQATFLIAKVKALDPRPVGLYMSAGVFFDAGQDFDWIADYRTGVPHTKPGTFHQYRGSPLDLDRYNGTLAELQALAAALPDSSTGDDVIKAGDGINFGVERWILDGIHPVVSIGARRLPDGTSDPALRLVLVGPGSDDVNFVARTRLTAGAAAPASAELLAALLAAELPAPPPADCTAQVAAAREHDRTAIIAAVAKVYP